MFYLQNKSKNMKKLIFLLLLLPAFVAGQTYTNTSTKSYFWKNNNKFLNVPYKANSGGTITDTLATQAYARQFGGGTADLSEVNTRIDSIVEAISDTTDLSTEFSTIIPKYINMSAAEIAAIEDPEDGTMLYDETNDVFVTRRNGAWVKLSYTSWP